MRRDIVKFKTSLGVITVEAVRDHEDGHRDLQVSVPTQAEAVWDYMDSLSSLDIIEWVIGLGAEFEKAGDLYLAFLYVSMLLFDNVQGSDRLRRMVDEKYCSEFPE